MESNNLQETLQKQNEQLELIATTVLGNSKKIDENSKRLDENSKRLNRMDLLVDTVLDNSDRLSNIEEKLDELPSAKILNDAINKADQILKKVTDTEQEDSMRTGAIRRVEERVEKNEQDIRQIKPLVGLAEAV